MFIKTRKWTSLLAAVLLGSAACVGTSWAQDAAPAAPAPAAAAPAAEPAPAPPTVEQRVAGLEAYVNNLDPAGSAVTGVPGPGHNAWMMTASALVLFMTLPGLALFYGGLVRSKNVLSVLAMCFGSAGLVTILWWAFGYSLVFGTSFAAPATEGGAVPFIGYILGGTEFFFMKGVTSAPNTNYAYWVSQNVYCIFQLTFAIITPALIFGATAERMKFKAVMAFIGLWMFLVYFPLAHMVWGASGLMNGVWNAGALIPAIDFAGGTVVHMSSGWSAIVLALILGKRLGFGKEPMPPHSMVLCMVGTGMLWTGWYGFNAGSAAAADGVAANAFFTTTLATGVGAFVWAMTEALFKGKPSVLGFCSGAVAGLVVITPACGFVNATGAVIIGVAAGIVPFFAVTYLKPMIGYDDALDTFGVHAVGGTMGALLTGLLATAEVNSNLVSDGYAAKNGLKTALENHTLWIAQLEAIGITIALAVVMTTIIALVLKVILGLRPTPEAESQGLDITDHGEEGYLLN